MSKIIHFHFDIKKNIGDAAVVFAIKDILFDKFHVTRYTSLPISYLSKVDFYEYFENILTTNQFLHKNSRQSKYIIKILVLIMLAAKYFKGSNKKRIISLINQHDIMIIGGGGIYSKWILPFDTDLINKIRIPIIIFGAGYNHNYSDKELSFNDRITIEILHKKVKIGSVRDMHTLKFINNDDKFILTGDPAIFLKSKKIDTIKFDASVIKIGLNISFHEEHTKSNADSVIEIYIKLIRELNRKYHIRIFYLKHSINEDYVIHKLKSSIPDIIICNYGPREMKYIYENLDLVISMMLHSSIFAYSGDTRFINIAYDIKNYAFMELIHNTENLIDLRRLTFATLYRKSIKILEDLENTRRDYVKKEYFRKNLNKFIKKI